MPVLYLATNIKLPPYDSDMDTDGVQREIGDGCIRNAAPSLKLRKPRYFPVILGLTWLKMSSCKRQRLRLDVDG